MLKMNEVYGKVVVPEHKLKADSHREDCERLEA